MQQPRCGTGIGGKLRRLNTFTVGAWPSLGLGRLRGRTPAPWRSTLGSPGTAMGTDLGTIAVAPRPAGGGGRERYRPQSSSAQDQETLSCLLPLPSTWLLPFRTVKRGPQPLPEEPLHVSPDYVSPSPYLLTKRDTLVESIPAGGWRSVERKSPGLLRLVFSLGRFSEGGRSLDPPHSLPLVFPSCAWGGDGACLEVLIVGEGGCDPFSFNNNTS